MDLLTLTRLIRRNIVAAIVGCLLAVGLVSYAVLAAPAVYHSSGTVVLFSPPAPPEPVPVDADDPVPTTTVASDNPYVRFNDLSVVVDIVRRVLVGSEVDRELRADGLVGTYTVASNIDFYRGPIIDIAAEAPTAEEAQRSTELVMAELAVALDDLQAAQGTDPEFRIVTQTVVRPNPGTRVLSSTVRRGMAATVLAACTFIGSLVLSDALRRPRTRGRSRRPSDVARADDEPALDDHTGRDDDTLRDDTADRTTLEALSDDLFEPSIAASGQRRVLVPDDDREVAPSTIRQRP